MGFPPVPASIKSIAHVLKVAEEHEERNILVAYWARMYACYIAMKLVPGTKPPEVTELLVALMEWMEKTKKANKDVEGIGSETVAQAMIEEYAMQLFAYADKQDREENFNKNMIKAFYTAGILMDILDQFGEVSEDIVNKRKYAKWKAAYIHNCLKSGDTPTSGGPDEHLNNVIDTSKSDNDDSPKDIIRGPGQVDGSTTFHVPLTPGPAPASSPVTPGLNVNQPEPQFPTPKPTPSTPLTPSPPTTSFAPSTDAGGAIMNPDTTQKAQKYCKFAISALNYDDYKTAKENLTKALRLLETGRDEFYRKSVGRRFDFDASED